jgi:hypothetical protein
MKILSLLCSLLSILAVVGIVAWPSAASAAAHGRSGGIIITMADDITDCSQQKPNASGHHQKARALMSHCTVHWLQSAPLTSDLVLVLQLASVLVPRDDAARRGLTEAPLPRPPRI